MPNLIVSMLCRMSILCLFILLSPFANVPHFISVVEFSVFPLHSLAALVLIHHIELIGCVVG